MNYTENKQSIFDESYVDCNDCQHYWDDSCDGVPKDDIRPCTAFKATKKTDIPKQLEDLSKRLKQSERNIIFLEILFCAHLFLALLFN